MALMKLEKPDGVKGVICGPTETVDKLAFADRSLLAFCRGFYKLWIQLAKPVSLDSDAAPEDLLVVVEIETADHPLNRSVMCVRVPATADCLAADNPGRSSQPDWLHFIQKATVQKPIVTHPSQRLGPQLTG